jgi:hypothetical protein
MEKAIEQRDTRAPWILPNLSGKAFRASPYWPPQARKMNLPVEEGRQFQSTSPNLKNFGSIDGLRIIAQKSGPPPGILPLPAMRKPCLS